MRILSSGYCQVEGLGIKRVDSERGCHGAADGGVLLNPVQEDALPPLLAPFHLGAAVDEVIASACHSWPDSFPPLNTG